MSVRVSDANAKVVIRWTFHWSWWMRGTAEVGAATYGTPNGISYKKNTDLSSKKALSKRRIVLIRNQNLHTSKAPLAGAEHPSSE